MVSSLVAGCDDSVSKVKNAVIDSLVEIGKSEPVLVLTKCKGALMTKPGEKEGKVVGFQIMHVHLFLETPYPVTQGLHFDRNAACN